MAGKLTLRPAAADAGQPRRPAPISAERLQRLKDRARELRREMTPAEELLWARLSGNKLGGIKFSRKTVVGSAIVDFACPSRWVVVSLSGPDTNSELEAMQDRGLADLGIRTLRFTEAEVLDDADRVAGQIATLVNTPFERGGRRAG